MELRYEIRFMHIDFFLMTGEEDEVAYQHMSNCSFPNQSKAMKRPCTVT